MDESRFRLIMDTLASTSDYARGDAPFPHPIDASDATFMTTALLLVIDEGTAARSRKAEAAGLRVACSAGCAWCCEQPILVWLPEAMIVAEFLARPENAGARARFLAVYPAWRDAIGDSHEKAVDAGASLDPDGFVRAHRAAWERRVPCAFNDRGLCTVYDARPAVCRHHHALDTAEHCRVDDPSGVEVSYLAFSPLDQLISHAKLTSSGLHHALGGAKMRMLSLCEAVDERLTRPNPPAGTPAPAP